MKETKIELIDQISDLVESILVPGKLLRSSCLWCQDVKLGARRYFRLR
jgi:hypothetical protein